MKRTEKNDLCPCGSGKKYSICCQNNDRKTGILRLSGSETLAQIEWFIEHSTWKDPIYSQIATLIKDHFYRRVPIKMIEDALSIWFSFSTTYEPNIRKPEMILAAIEYLMIDDATIDATANKYRITTASVTKWYEMLEDFINEDLEIEIIEAPALPQTLSNPSISIQPVTSLSSLPSLNSQPTLQPSSKLLPNAIQKERAHNLSIEALTETQLTRKIELAKEAYELDPDCIDAQIILTQFELKTPKEQFRQMKQIIEKATELLGGPAFFQENKGVFWQLPHTRPYMRARSIYAKMLCEIGLLEEAIEQYHQLLLLNPMDHQGFRYRLLNLFIETGEVHTALKLIDVYDEQTTPFLYSRLLCHYLQDGIGEHLIPSFQKAIKQNRYVLERFNQGSETQYAESVHPIQEGTIDEADFYLKDAWPIWQTQPNLLQWMNVQKTERKLN